MACGSDSSSRGDPDVEESPDASLASDSGMGSSSDSGSGKEPGDPMSDAGTAEEDAPDAALADAQVPEADASEAEPDAGAECVEGATCVLSALWACADGHETTTPCDKGCSAAACNTTCDAEQLVIDQSQFDDHADTSGTQWQSFKLEATGVLTALELRPNVYSEQGEPSFITIALHVGEGIAAEPLYQQQYTLASVGSSPWHTFTFDTPVPLQAEQTYTWSIAGAASVHYAKSDVYAGGRAKLAAGYDMTFRLHAAACH